MAYRLESNYLSYLANIEGNDFQNEIEKLASDSIPDFQPISAISGDGGVDGLLKGNTELICCYGLELKIPLLTKALILTKIKSKFLKDLHRILELEVRKKEKATKGAPKIKKEKEYDFYENKKIKESLGIKKIKVIRLITNYDASELVGHFSDLFEVLKGHSQCNYIEKDCSIIYLGPAKLCTYFHVTEKSLSRLKNKKIYEALEDCKAIERNGEVKLHGYVDDLEDFNNKFDYLETTNPLNTEDVKSYKKETFDDLCKYIAFIQKLKKESPLIYEKVVQANLKIKKILKERGLTNRDLDIDQQMNLIEACYKEKWTDIIDGLPSEKLDELIDMNKSYLVATCPLDWRKKSA